jgi:hypothetical protein
MKAVLMGSILLLVLPLAAHASGWFLLCPYAPGHQPGLEQYWQNRAYDTATDCETGRDAFEKQCARDARHKQLSITCNCKCWPARTCD